MASVNKVVLIGHAGQDPELRHTESGTAVVNLTVATTTRWATQGQGEKKERTEWHRVVVWGKQAEYARAHVTKGAELYVEGSLQTREWTDRTGGKRTTTEIQARRIELLGRRADSQSENRHSDGTGEEVAHARVTEQE